MPYFTSSLSPDVLYGAENDNISRFSMRLKCSSFSVAIGKPCAMAVAPIKMSLNSIIWFLDFKFL